MIKIIYQGKDFKKIEKKISNAFNFIYKTFPIKTRDLTIRVYNNRNDFSERLGRKTEDWLVALASDKEINILSPDAIEKESNHNKKEFLQILKHEFTHFFISNFAKKKTIPKWLNEGLAAYVAGQHKNEKIFFTINGRFCKKLSTTKDWNNEVKKGAYTISATFVSYLIKKYSLKKIKELLVSMKKDYSYSDFKNTFINIYKINLEDAENIFIKNVSLDKYRKPANIST